MKVRNLNAARGLVVAALLAVLAFVLLVQYAPDSVAFSPNNYGWNGLQGVASAYNVNFTMSLSSIPHDGVLAVLQPNINYSAADADSIRNFLMAGGTVLVADKSGVANSLLQGIGSSITIEEQFSIIDPVYNWKAASFPTALVLPGAATPASYFQNVSGLALNQPSPLFLSSPEALQVAVTSQFSENQAGSRGPFAVVASQRMGSGTLIVVGDSQFLLNSEWSISDNKILIGNFFANGDVFVDASHWTANPLTSSTAQVKAGLRDAYDAVAAVPARYAFVIGLVLLSFALVPTEGHYGPERQSEESRSSTTPFNDRREGT
jgi:hypothetical protein